MAFDINIGTALTHEHECPPPQPPPPRPIPLRDQSIITNKVYDSCRRQDCLELIAHAAEPIIIGDKHIAIGEVIPVPHGAGSVVANNLTIKKITVISKEPSPFKRGFWDTAVRFVFEYELTFRKCDKDILLCVKANSIHHKKFCLFGSAASDFVAATDLFNRNTFDNGTPNIWVDAKAVALKTEFRCNHRDRKPVDVCATIGLFCILKLSRIVCLNVSSKGFCVPRECDFNPTDPCAFFHSLDFPMDTFAPLSRSDMIAKRYDSEIAPSFLAPHMLM